jgi:hypothetical protein
MRALFLAIPLGVSVFRHIDIPRSLIGAIVMLCLLPSLVACSEGPPDRPDRGQSSPEPGRSTTAITTPEEDTTGAPAESSVLESTVGGAILRRDEGVLRIGRAELLRSERSDEIFVKATVTGPAEARDCYLIKGSTWFVLRDAIESGDVSDLPAVLAVSWADPALTTRFSGNDTLAVSFKADHDHKDGGPDPRETPFFAICYKFAGDGTGGATWYDVVHVEGTPRAK